ncbi:MAG: 4-hydroxyphenylacetate 3-monooxygenase, oxygenase component [Anaerolineales bacterium]|nr:4-hydroxyphenylacetate 3-monooxygenase, oxygenase component [Anaerolineales bacterium]
MGARHGNDVIEKLKTQPIELWHRGQRVADVTAEPGLSGGVRSLAELYDLQWRAPEAMLFASPDTGNLVGRSFMVPRTLDELQSVGTMMLRWARHTFGMMGRTPDYLNRALAAFAGSADFLGQLDPRFADNARRCHAHARENDLCLTHTLINPQSNRNAGPARQADPFLAARVKAETDAGLVIQGARMLATLPISDEIMVFPSTLLKATEEDAPYAFGFAISNATPGLKFLCRETVDYGRSVYDHPLGSRFEELDAVVIFDEVFVPWERVFLYRDVAACNQAYAATGAVAHMSHQVVCKNIAKTEFILGLVSLMISAIGIEGFQHIHEKTAEIWCTLEAMKAFKRAAEVDAAPNAYGVMTPAWDPLDAARNMYPRLYPRLVEIVQQVGASGLVSMPTLADVRGPLKDDIAHYYQAARAEARDRIPLFRLAWDTAVSAFGSRQVLYERFYFGDPVRMAGALFHGHDRQPYMDMVREFLQRGIASAAEAEEGSGQ